MLDAGHVGHIADVVQGLAERVSERGRQAIRETPFHGELRGVIGGVSRPDIDSPDVEKLGIGSHQLRRLHGRQAQRGTGIGDDAVERVADHG